MPPIRSKFVNRDSLLKVVQMSMLKKRKTRFQVWKSYETWLLTFFFRFYNFGKIGGTLMSNM